MTFAFWVTFCVILFITTTTILFVFRYRTKIPMMTGMRIAMTLGMMVGIVGGTLIGIVYAGDLFTSTIIGSILGMVIGFFSGISVSLMAVIDGMVSGLMGGLMGSMLGDMIVTNNPDTLVRILMVIFVVISLILFYLMGEEVDKPQSRFFRNPIMMAIIVIIFFAIYSQLGTVVPSKINMDIDIHQLHK